MDKKNPNKSKSSIWLTTAVTIMGFLVILGGWLLFSKLTESKTESATSQDISAKSKANVNQKNAPTMGSSAPDFTLRDLEDNNFHLYDFNQKDKVLLIFWRTTCGYCKKELPHLKSFYQENKEEMEIIAIVMRESKNTVQNYIKENQIEFKVLLDINGKVSEKYWVTGTPSHFLLNKNKEVIYLRPGYSSKEDLDMMMF